MTEQERQVLYRATRYSDLMGRYTRLTAKLEAGEPLHEGESPEQADALFDMAQDTLQGLEDVCEGMAPEAYL